MDKIRFTIQYQTIDASINRTKVIADCITKEDGGEHRYQICVYPVFGKPFHINKFWSAKARDEVFEKIKLGQHITPDMMRPPRLTNEFALQILKESRYNILHLKPVIEKIHGQKQTHPLRWDAFKDVDPSFFISYDVGLLKPDIYILWASTLPMPLYMRERHVTPEQFWRYLCSVPVIAPRKWSRKNNDFWIPSRGSQK